MVVLRRRWRRADLARRRDVDQADDERPAGGQWLRATIGTTYVTAGNPFDSGNTGNTFVYACWPDAMAVDRARERHTRDEPTLRLRHARRRVPLHARQLGLARARSTDGISWSLVLSPGAGVAPGQGESPRPARRDRDYNGTTYVAVGEVGIFHVVRWHHVDVRGARDRAAAAIVGVAWARGSASSGGAAGNVGNSLYILTSPESMSLDARIPDERHRHHVRNGDPPMAGRRGGKRWSARRSTAPATPATR